LKIKKENWIVLIGLFDGEPYEMFCGKSENIQLEGNPEKGTIKKHAKGRYSLLIDDKTVVKNIIESFDNREYAWATRFISLALRHGVLPEIVLEQLTKDGDITDINKVLSRTIKKYIKDGTKPVCSSVCPNCGSENIRFESACKSCLDCKWSKCG
jgi:ribonucleoside-diphosphate reductase alpha chain